jgi:hypothetical protein
MLASFHGALPFPSQHAWSLVVRVQIMFRGSSLRREMGEAGTCEPWAADCRCIFSCLKALDSRASLWSVLVLVLKIILRYRMCARANDSSLSENSAIQGAFHPPSFPLLACLLLQFIRVSLFVLVMVCLLPGRLFVSLVGFRVSHHGIEEDQEIGGHQ